ncbi:MAG TPA: DUF3618 domain-containing protein [Solirubrobacteraceae bacterium]|jgi:hypothetical protein
MGEEPRTGGTQVTDQGTREPAEIRSDIEVTRRELGDTVEALAAKADVKAQAQKKVADVKQTVDARRRKLMGRAREATPDNAGSAASGVATKAREHPVPLGLAGAFVVGLLVGRMLSRG